MMISIMAALAALSPYSADFSVPTGLNGWVRSQNAPETRIEWHSSGCLVVNIQDDVPGNESVGYVLDGSLLGNETVEAQVGLVNTHNNYYRVSVQLWNITDDILLAESEELLVYGLNHDSYTPVNITVRYSATEQDRGKFVQLRLKEACNGAQRNIAVDQVSVICTLRIHDLGVALSSVNVRSADFGTLPDGTPAVFSTSNGEPLTFNVLDASTGGRIHSVEVSDEMMAGSVHQSPDGSVYFNAGTAGLFRYLPQTEVLIRIGSRIGGQQWLRDVVSDADGTLYMSTYPDAKLLAYDPQSGEIRDYGSVTDDATYAYTCAVVEDEIWVGTGPVPYLIAVDRESGAIREIEVPARFMDPANYIVKLYKRGHRVFVRFSPGRGFAVYNLRTGEWTDVKTGARVVGMTDVDENGRVYFLAGRRLYRYDLESGEIEEESGLAGTPAAGAFSAEWRIYDIGLMYINGRKAVAGITNAGNLWCYFPEEGTGQLVQADILESATRVIGFGTGPDGQIYAGGKIGVGMLARIDPQTHRIEPISGPSQAEGIGGQGSVILIGDYSGAGLNMGDLSKPWSWGKNPRRLFNLGRGAPYHQDRIWAIEAIGKRFALGTIPEPGQNGGSLTLFDPETEAYEVHRHVVENQSVVDLIAGGGLLYGATSIHGGAGTPNEATEACLFIWDPQTDQKIWEGVPVPGSPVINGLCWTPDGMLWGISETGEVFEFDPQSRHVTRVTSVGAVSRGDMHGYGNHSSLVYDEGSDRFAGTAGGRLFLMDRKSLNVQRPGAEHEILRLVRAGNGNIYGTGELQLFFIELTPPEKR